MNWLFLSNRLKHLLYAIPVGLILTILAGIGVAGGMEFKDREYGNQWDWYDFLATVIGSAIGQIIQLIIIFSFI